MSNKQQISVDLSLFIFGGRKHVGIGVGGIGSSAIKIILLKIDFFERTNKQSKISIHNVMGKTWFTNKLTVKAVWNSIYPFRNRYIFNVEKHYHQMMG